jgi:glutamyl-tRNA reductase
MNIGLLGISYRSSELELRERFARACQKMCNSSFSDPLVLLSTCNRTEIYFSSDDLVETYSHLLSMLETLLELECRSRIYCYFGEKCFIHLAKVTAGIDSVIFGEAEIQRQVKQAYEEARARHKFPFIMHYLFQKSLKIGKEIRTQFPLRSGRASMEWALWDLTKCFFPEGVFGPILFIGYSEINRKMIRFFQRKIGGRLYLATRNEDAAMDMTKKMGLQLVSWKEIGSWTEFPIVVCGSKSSEYLLKAEHIAEDRAKVQSRLVIDLSLPRNVDPCINKNPLITLFNIEEIEQFIDQKHKTSFMEQTKIAKKIEDSVNLQSALFHRKRSISCV